MSLHRRPRNRNKAQRSAVMFRKIFSPPKQPFLALFHSASSVDGKHPSNPPNGFHLLPKLGYYSTAATPTTHRTGRAAPAGTSSRLPWPWALAAALSLPSPAPTPLLITWTRRLLSQNDVAASRPSTRIYISSTVYFPRSQRGSGAGPPS